MKYEDENEALIQESGKGDCKYVDFLLKKGINVNCQNEVGETALSFAACWNQLNCLKLLLKYDADPNIADKSGGTPLMLAAQYGSSEMVKILIDCGANIKTKDRFGFNAFHHIKFREDLSVDEENEMLELLNKE